MKLHWIISFLFLNTIHSSNASNIDRINLNGNWEFQQAGTNQWYPATVPGVVHLDLLHNKLIEDPYFGNNELKLAWIEKENWDYRKIVNISAQQLEKQYIELVFKGLDTYSTVSINGAEILKTDNMFRTWIIDIKPFLNIGDNELLVHFESPLNRNLKRIENQAYELPAANENVATKVSPYTRKAAYHFGWDWGPRFVTSGIWRPCYIQFWNDLEVRDVFYQSKTIQDSTATVEFTFEIQSNHTQRITLEIGKFSKEIELQKGINTVKQSLEVNNFKLWNPIGYGKQDYIYITYRINSENKKTIEEKMEIAIRNIELIQEKDDIGTAFYFKVNDQPIFIKGANYIPQDLFLPRVDSARYEKLIEQALAANINMLRVWGGGIYENDYFYDLCDQNGILVWQDFMFANSMYPNDSSFLANIEGEVRDNVKRLRNHPCIAVWCGNNEIEVAWNNWGWQKQFNYTKEQETAIYANYEYIFQEMIPNTLAELTPKAAYTPTSPLSNWGKDENFNHSSMHYWGVWHGNDPIEAFSTHVGRFMVEFGYQSYPNYSSLLKSIDSIDMHLESEIMQNRQKSYVGNGIIEENILKYMYKEADFAKWIQLSQTVQSCALSTAISAHRFKTPHCMGTIFWQFNDCWPGPSWSIIDYNGNEKQAYAAVRNFYAPIIAKCEMEEDILTTTFTCDDPTNGNCMVSIEAVTSKGRVIPLIQTQLSLDFLTPYDIFLQVPISILSKKSKDTLSHFRISIIQNDELIFESDYYPNSESTVYFPKG